MTPPLCYVAAPFSDPSETIRAWHVARARLLARLALACGYAPVVVHGEIEAGTYGDDSDPEQRARGMAATMAICRGVLATPGAVLWALTRDDGTMSPGVEAEVAIGHSGWRGRSWYTWAEWRESDELKRAPDLLPEWDRLATRPDAVGEWQIRGSRSECRMYASGRSAAYNGDDLGWEVYDHEEQRPFAEGPETGALGRAAADAALRRAGVMA